MTFTPDDEVFFVKEQEMVDTRTAVYQNRTKDDDVSATDDVPGLSITSEESNDFSKTSSTDRHQLRYQSSAAASSLTVESDEPENLDLTVAVSKDPFASFTNGERLNLPEWVNANDYRAKSGWQGHDLVHSVHSAVRVLDYYCQYGAGTDISCVVPRENSESRLAATDSFADVGTQEITDNDASTISYQQPSRGGAGTILTGYVHFTKRAESHKGFCHGGAACSIMDDVLGWTAFCVTGQVLPWSGYTVQINTQLRRPIPVDSFVYVSGTITSVVRRKVFISAQLYDVPKTSSREEDQILYATCEGIVVLNKEVLHVPEATASIS